MNVINNRLAERFGADLQGNPNFRISWTTTQLEYRKGYFPIGNTGLINAEKEIREVPKYPLFPDRYVLEKKCYLPPIGELPEAEMRGYSYESIFMFHDANGNRLDPIWRVIEIIVYSALKGPENVFTARTEDLEKDKITDAEIEYFERYLENESPYLATMLHNREAVQHDSTKAMKENKSAD